jgi:outer membrane biosynthesis protein TonB
MKLSLMAISLLFLFAGDPQGERQPIIYVKHLEPPLHYPLLARQTRMSGTIVMKLKIGVDGAVLAIESSPGDSRTTGFATLRDDAEKTVKTWTFGCVGVHRTPLSSTL